jgi:hypothetical protein
VLASTAAALAAALVESLAAGFAFSRLARGHLCSL